MHTVTAMMDNTNVLVILIWSIMLINLSKATEKSFLNIFKEQPRLADSDDFYELVVNEVFVDKSQMIEEFLTSGKIVRIVRPRGWGKTVNLKMLQRFFESREDNESAAKNRRLFFGGEYTDAGSNATKKLLKPLKISTAKREVLQKLGRYGVVQMNFRYIIGENRCEIEDGIRNLVRNAYNDMAYLVENVTPDERDVYESYVNGTFNIGELLGKSLQFLCELLSRRHNSYKTYILIDEYDAPVNHMFVNLVNEIRTEHPETRYEEVCIKATESKRFVEMFCLLDTLHDWWFTYNPYIEQALLTGIFNLQFGTLRTLGKDSIYNAIDRKFSKAYGFTEDELDELLPASSSSSLSSTVDRKTVKNWYSYDFLDQIRYNPWSITHFIANDFILDDYWIQAGSIPMVTEVLLADSVQEDIQRLIDGDAIEDDIRHDIKYQAITSDLTLLFFSGYLSLPSYKYKRWSELKAANVETVNALKKNTMAWLCERLDTTYDRFIFLAEHLIAFQLKEFEQTIKTITSSFPNFEYPSDSKVWYNALMKCVAQCFGPSYDVDHRNVDGQLEKMFFTVQPKSSIPKRNRNNAVILKYSIAYSGEQLNLTNDFDIFINEPKYKFDQTKLNDVKNVLKVLLIFCEQNVGVRYKIIEFASR